MHTKHGPNLFSVLAVFFDGEKLALRWVLLNGSVDMRISHSCDADMLPLAWLEG